MQSGAGSPWSAGGFQHAHHAQVAVLSVVYQSIFIRQLLNTVDLDTEFLCQTTFERLPVVIEQGLRLAGAFAKVVDLCLSSGDLGNGLLKFAPHRGDQASI
ncbi:hypothetical protein EYB53_000255 [Candidatus Chloroploca sp. M-50]|uniref:Uncharacterized protein n=1 Tax=Candidatus Chloroploca mongolica TaxID=2528176 RepID=A0ABS4D3X3_9CHLR|nr:hypothetical protein [Candidatus Chloroploca mongolica]MBP1464127.1 hypothetical protein [Candidatus Chloroploca mongolica]